MQTSGKALNQPLASPRARHSSSHHGQLCDVRYECEMCAGAAECLIRVAVAGLPGRCPVMSHARTLHHTPLHKRFPDKLCTSVAGASAHPRIKWCHSHTLKRADVRCADDIIRLRRVFLNSSGSFRSRSGERCLEFSNPARHCLIVRAACALKYDLGAWNKAVPEWYAL